MQPATISMRTSLRTILVGLITLFLVFLVYFIPDTSIHRGFGSAVSVENIIALSEQEQARFGLPTRLKIPSINIDTPIEYVGLTSDGAMGAPKERANVAWFDLGPRPGESGSAVISGHYGRQNWKGSVFDDLHKLRKGDKIYIEDFNGQVVSFEVRENRRYDPNEDALEVFGSSDGKSHLNLITCEGVWDESIQQYPKRLVVFTDKE